MHAVSQLEVRSEVTKKQLLLGVLLDGSHDLLIKIFLILFALGIGLESRLVLGENVTFGGLLGTLLGLLHLEVFIINVLGNLDARDIDLGAGHDDELLVHTTKWALVNDEGAVDKQKTRSELLQENNTLSTVLASQDNADSARLET